MARVLTLVGGTAVAAILLFGPGATSGGSARANLLRGSTQQGSFASQALEGRVHYAVYLPPGYGSSMTRYPVIYFLHGLPASPQAYQSITPIASAVEASGHDAIVVGMQGSRQGDEDPEWLDRGPGRRWETATAVELVSVIDHRYRTLAARSGRILIGVSAGGYGATLIAAHHPATYSVIESWSGYFHPTDPTGTKALDLGTAEANDWADFHKLIPTLKRRFAPYLKTTYYSFYVGTNDARFRAENEETSRELRAAGLAHVYFRLYPGGHEWTLWAQHARGWVGSALSAAAPPSQHRS
jgi:enterochelin esterase-like enzyme